MDDKQRQEWKKHNQQLQQAYEAYNAARFGKSSSQQKAKDDALRRIEQSLSWEPFLNFYFEQVGSDPSGFGRHSGLEYQSERCIERIDKIAKDEESYDY